MSGAANKAPGSAPGAASLPARVARGLAVVIRGWAVLGGLIVCGLAVMTAYSATAQVVAHAPFSPSYELTKLLIAVAIFAFLPYCQLTGANVTVDIFTEGLGPGKKALMAILSALFALGFSALLLRQMWLGFGDYMAFPEVTPVLQLPLWTAFPPILVSLALWVAAALISLVDALRVARGRSPFVAADGIQISE
ncbi:TRAP transporter small permease [Acidimangrovimonas sediminis]|uniref:TRAP transporter small permease n=1 Tax=Acidimangrovimonas sediminis TaxID=2056283 RepID=UPI000C808D8D|nr:TRAP transporter small permease [Acidimangrovimonas sediminis]